MPDTEPPPSPLHRPAARLRMARSGDAPALAAIYAHFVTATTVSLEEVPPDADELARRLDTTLPRWPWLVAVEGDRHDGNDGGDRGHRGGQDRDGDVVGYAYAGPYRGRPGYRWCVEVSAYVAPTRHRGGLGRGLYDALLALLAHQGHRQALAGIGLPNATSVAFHEALGFRHAGTLVSVGRKFGTWQDVGWWQRPLGVGATEPVEEPLGVDGLPSDVVAGVLAGVRDRW